MRKFIVFLIAAILNTFSSKAETIIKGHFSNKSPNAKVTVVYEKDFLVRKTSDLTLDEQGQFQIALDIVRMTSMEFTIDSLYFKMYLFPNDKASVYADLKSKQKFVETLKFGGDLSDLNRAFFDVQYKSPLKNVHWRTGEKAAPEIIVQKINHYYALKRKLLREALPTSPKKEAVALGLDSISDEYTKAGAILNLLPRNGIRDDAAWEFVKKNIPAAVITQPDDTLLNVPAVRMFWTHNYLKFLIERDIDKEPNLYRDKGYYLSALKKVDTAFNANLKVHGKASLLFDLLQDPTMFRPGADSLFRLTEEFVKISPLKPEVKKVLLHEVNFAISRSLILKEGDTVPGISGLKPDGSSFSFIDYKDQTVLIDVWASWCLPCIGQMPEMKKHEEYFARKKVVYLMISVDEDAKRWRLAAERYAPGLKHILADGGLKGEFSKNYNINYIPRYILVKNSKIENPNLPLPSDPHFIDVLNKHLD